METLPKISLTRLFEDMDDPRVVGRCSYPLVELVLIGICAVLCGAETGRRCGAQAYGRCIW